MNPSDPAVSGLLEDFKEGVLTCLFSTLAALYVYGSLVMDDFSPQTSDIDFLAVVTHLPEHSHCLEDLHTKLAEIHEYGGVLEGDYIPLCQLSSQGGSGTCFGFYRGVFSPDVQGNMISSDNIMALREKSIILYGPHPQELLPDVGIEEMRTYMVKLLKEYTEYENDDPAEISSEVLNTCRSWHAALHNEILSKREAGGLVMKKFPEWAPLIKVALDVRSGIHDLSLLRSDLKKLAEALLEDIDGS